MSLILSICSCRGKEQEQGSYVLWSAVTFSRSSWMLHSIQYPDRYNHLELRKNTLNTFYAYAIHSSSTLTLAQDIRFANHDQGLF
jgi:hypothetical protein